MTDLPLPDSCVVHISDYDPDCEMCKSEVAAIEFATRNNAAANTVIEKRLAMTGRPVSMTNIIAIRLNTLIDSACAGNPKTRAKFELAFMSNYAIALQNADQQPVQRLVVPGG